MQLARPGSGVLAARSTKSRGLLAGRPQRSAAVNVRAVAETKKAPGSMNPIEKEVAAKLRYMLGKTRDYDAADAYQGTAWSVREHLIDSFENTHDYWE